MHSDSNYNNINNKTKSSDYLTKRTEIKGYSNESSSISNKNLNNRIITSAMDKAVNANNHYYNSNNNKNNNNKKSYAKSNNLAEHFNEKISLSAAAAQDAAAGSKSNLIKKNSSSNNNNNKTKMSNSQAKSNNTRRKSIARERWEILRNAILNREAGFQNSKSSIRRFDTFGFVKCVKLAYTDSLNNNDYRIENENRYVNKYEYNTSRKNDVEDDDDDDICYDDSKSSSKHRTSGKHEQNQLNNNYEWFNVSVPSVDTDDSIKVRFYKGPIGLNELVGFNNTGNICLWPSEEIMTYFCIKNSAIFDNKSVCELGGGMTCLGGLMISKCSQPSEVFLTDGNESCFENLEVICSENEFSCSVECCLLQWNKATNYGDLENRFDYIICADCLFFDEFREDLCATIYKLLKMDGTCLIFAPNRQNSFHKFVDMAKLHFECMIVHDYDMEIWEKHLDEKENNPDYDEDIHYPLLLKLKKRTRATNDFCKMVL